MASSCTPRRVRALARRVGKASLNVAARGRRSTDTAVQSASSRRAASQRNSSRRDRFPTVVEARSRRDGVVELTANQQQPVGGGTTGTLGQPPTGTAHNTRDTLSSQQVEAVAEAAGAALERPQVTVQGLPAGAADAVRTQPHQPEQQLTEEERSLQAQAAAQAAPPMVGRRLGPVAEESIEGSQAPSALSSPKAPAPPSSFGGSPLRPSTTAPSTVASPSQASEARLLTEVPLLVSDGVTADPAAAEPGGVAAGRVSKRQAGPSRFSRALGCFDWRKSGSSGAVGSGDALATEPARVEAAAVAPASTAASPSIDSRASSRVLLSDRVRRSDLTSTAGEAGAARAADTSGDEGQMAELEAVPATPGQPGGEAAPGLSAEAGWGAAAAESAEKAAGAVASGAKTVAQAVGAGAERTAEALASAATPVSEKTAEWWTLLRDDKSAEVAVADLAAAAAAGRERAKHAANREAESPNHRIMRAAFEVWRQHCVEAAWKRHGRPPRPGDEPVHEEAGQPLSVSSDEEDEDGLQGEALGPGAHWDASEAAVLTSLLNHPLACLCASLPQCARRRCYTWACTTRCATWTRPVAALARSPCTPPTGSTTARVRRLKGCWQCIERAWLGFCIAVRSWCPQLASLPNQPASHPPSPGVDLFYQDRLSAPGQALLLGQPLPWDFGEVYTPGGRSQQGCTGQDAG